MEFKYWDTMAGIETGDIKEEEFLEPAVEESLIVEEKPDELQAESVEPAQSESTVKSVWDAKRITLLVLLKIPLVYPFIALGLVLLLCSILVSFVLSLVLLLSGVLSLFGAVGLFIGVFGPLISVSFAPILLSGIAIFLIGAMCLFFALAFVTGFLLIPCLAKLLVKDCRLFGKIV